jgi:ATP-dependent helicase HepA
MARINPDKGFSRPEITQPLLKYMLEKSEDFAEEKVDALINDSLEQMVSTLSYEAKRLIALKEVNPNVTEEEIEFAKERIASLHEHISSARLRLDSLRLICNNPDKW